MKRAFDVVVGALLATLALPLIVAAAIAVACSLRTWRVFFVQERVGYRGRRFHLVKLRTLPLDMSPTADKYAVRDVVLTRVGAFLRRTHLDELPQLFLVCTGRMSLVGPRPEMPHLESRMPAHATAARRRLRPGCTGLWQISQDAHRMMHETPEYDVFYAEHRTFALDIWILGLTLRTLVGRAAPVQLSDCPVPSAAFALVADEA